MRGWILVSLMVFAGTLAGCGASVSGNQSESSRPISPTTAETSGPESTRESSTTGTTTRASTASSTESTTGQRFALRTERTPLQGPTTTAGFGSNSLWLFDLGDYRCKDTGGAGACVAPERVFLRRMPPATKEVSAVQPLEASEVAGVAFGAGSAWIAANLPGPASGVLFESDAKTSKVLARLTIASPAGVAFGEGSVWVTSADRGTLLRLDPRTGEATANIKVSEGGTNAVEVGDKAVWVASWGAPARTAGHDRFGGKKVVRVDPETNRVTAEIPVEEKAPEGGASSVAVDEESGAVWTTSVNGKLFRLDPQTNRKVAEVELGDYAWEVETFAGDAWVIYETGVYDPSKSATRRVARIDSATNQVVGSVEAKGASDLAVGREALWLTTSSMEDGTGSLTRIVP